MGCVECMCVMTLLQEHVSCRHSDHHQVLPDLVFELTEWQQAGYKQKLKWTLECDRCDFKTTSKGKMFEHVATHQVSEFFPGLQNALYLLRIVIPAEFLGPV